MDSKKAKKLDFIVIGAAKAGTTPLFEYIKKHSEINLPSGKEVSFFSNEDVYKKGYGWYLDEINKDRKSDGLLGTVTPQYMLGQLDTPPELVAKRIKKHCPNVKLIAILRNPADRAFSQYKMARRRGYTDKSFETVVNELVENKSATATIDPVNQIILGSEYGRALKAYYDLFPRKNILVLFAEDLRKDPDKVLKKVFEFLNINTSLKLEKPKKTIHKGGFKPKYRFLTPSFLYKIPGLKYAWNSLAPYALKKRVEFGINSWNVQPDDIELDHNGKAYEALSRHLRDDIKLLEKLTKKKMPWDGFSTKT